MAYVYGHYKADTGDLFYIGKGTGDRAWSNRKRNKHWRHTVNKHGYVVKILEDNLTEELAYVKEKQLIEEVGLENLTNMTDGGRGGTSGRECSQETRDKISKAKRGKKRPKEISELLSRVHKGKTISLEMRKRLSEINKGKEPWNKGKPAWNKGIPMSEESKKKLSESRKALFKRIKNE